MLEPFFTISNLGTLLETCCGGTDRKICVTMFASPTQSCTAPATPPLPPPSAGGPRTSPFPAHTGCESLGRIHLDEKAAAYMYTW